VNRANGKHHGVIDKAFEHLMRVIERVLAYAFVFAVCLNFTNVVGRYGLGRTILWADEVQVYIMVWMAFLGAVVASWRNIHLRMDVLVRGLPRRWQAWVKALEMLAVLVLTGFVVLQSSNYVGRIFALEQRSDTGGIPMWIPHSAVVLGFLLVALVTLWRAFQLATGRGGTAEAVPERREL
jgi:TRAP-type C4-dicarboxylate transport system permease small subunit